MSVADVPHHHRNTTKVGHKSFKSRHASKNALKAEAKGKINIEKGVRRTQNQQVMSKFDRKNHAKQKRQNAEKQRARHASVFSARNGAPRIVAVIPLCSSIDLHDCITRLNDSLDIAVPISSTDVVNVDIDRFKQRISYLQVERELWSALDACKIADYVLLVLSAEEEVDSKGEHILRAIESQGISTVYTAIQGIENIQPAKKRAQTLVSLKSFITHFFAEQEKLYLLDSRQECQNLIRSLCTTLPKGIIWRDDRSWMLADDVNWDVSEAHGESGLEVINRVSISGFVRGKPLKADRLLHVGDWGDFQIASISIYPPGSKAKQKETRSEAAQSTTEYIFPSDDKDLLEELAPHEIIMEDVEHSVASRQRRGVLIDGQSYYSDKEEEDDQYEAARRVPIGTSKYQASWYLADMSDSGSDLESVQDGETGLSELQEAEPADGPSTFNDIRLNEAQGIEPSEYPESEMMEGLTLEADNAAVEDFRRERREAKDDLQFPDEIELHPDVLARERLARYRGLTSLKTSPWDREEDKLHQPEQWTRLLDISNYNGARRKVTNEALAGGISPGTRVTVIVKDVPLKYLQGYVPDRPLPVFSLLRHEHKHTALNYSISIPLEFEQPLKSKDQLIVQCGYRKLAVQPLYSQSGTTSNDVHKYQRYLHPGRTAVASFIGPVTWGNVPVLFFRQRNLANPSNIMHDSTAEINASNLELFGLGTSLSPSTSRVIAKRIVLTGQPYKINRRLVSIRYMFFNAEDVAWFKALRLWTNKGRQGTIKESLGTHGHFKATFDSKIGMQEAVGISLYKRVWPRNAVELHQA